ncbi:MAG: hypothetical protein AAGJ53_06545, partial [Pseudomonadota bacterium]
MDEAKVKSYSLSRQTRHVCRHLPSRHRSRALLVAFAVFLFGAPLTATNAIAELIVLQSTAPGLKAGAVLQKDQTVDIPSGKSAILIMPSGATKTLTGPVKQTVAELTRGQSTNAALLKAVKKYVVTGGTSSATVGALRNVAPSAEGPQPFALDGVPITARGPYCVVKGADLKLLRTRTGERLDVTIVSMADRKRGKSSFGAKQTATAWPKDIAVAQGDFAIAAPRQAMRKVSIRFLAKVPAADQMLPALFAAKCESQIAAFL